MKKVTVWRAVFCRTCKVRMFRKEKAWKVSEGCNPKYYCLEHKPKEY